MRLLTVLSFGLFVLAGTNALAGWTSGGGDLLRDSQNPWFIQNTQVVKYCVAVDEKNFGVKRSRISDFVLNALKYWQKELGSLPSTQVSGQYEFRLGTQIFNEVDCADEVDVRFQFGVLSKQQRKKLGPTNEIVGVAVRTEYDQVNLKGKGFIYISPESGPLKLKLDNVHQTIWHLAHGAILYPTLLHEIGHMFGVRHTSGNGSGLMDERYLEAIVQDRRADLWAEVWSEIYRLHMEPGFFKFRSETLPTAICQTPRPLIMDFFEIDPHLNCYKASIQDSHLLVYSGSAIDKLELSGQADLESKDSPESEVAINIYVNPSQNIFLNNNSSAPFLALANSRKIFFKGLYKSIDGKTQKDVSVQVSPAGNKQFSGQISGKSYLDLALGF